ncbi:unnamed protein product [Miscanthus lutarioriparius]|uniref:Fatty acid desaturase N-terminal domain-containing protein n=1 Tax=Miscanthus lutarioriparius TaxID=422564 RepID=A0A811NGV1_9POAL|nr:unnamed protein product [Miscanthus lutarioriparius]
MAAISHRIAGSGPRVAVVAPPRPRGRAAVVAGAAAKGAHRERTLEGASDDLRAAAAKCLDRAPARRRVRAAFAPVLPTLDHCLFKVAPKGIQMEEGRRLGAGHQATPGTGHQARPPATRTRGAAGRDVRVPGGRAVPGALGPAARDRRQALPAREEDMAANGAAGGEFYPGAPLPFGLAEIRAAIPKHSLGLCCLSGGPKLQSLGKVILVALAATMHVVRFKLYCPVNVVCWKRAICLEFIGKADVLEYYDQTVSSRSGSFYIPAVFRANDAIGDWKEEGAAARR